MKNPVNISRLTAIPLRDVWKDEAYDFTPWLASDENIELLGETIGRRLEVESVEHAVGRYSADIVCKDLDTGGTVLIENQLTKSDHRHLGQICTYAAGVGAETIVWLAENICPEHREAVDWLNSISDDKTNFYAVKLQAWRIGGSLPAPGFEVVSQPALLAREARKDVRQLSETALTDHQIQQVQYWADFISTGTGIVPDIEQRVPYKGCWQTVRTFNNSDGVAMEFNVYASKKNLRAEAYIYLADAKLVFEALQLFKAEIETEYGGSLKWENPSDKNYCRIADYHPDGAIDFGPNSSSQHVWLANSISKLIPAVMKFIPLLDIEAAALRLKENEE